MSLLKIYQEFKNHKNKEEFINCLIKLAEIKSIGYTLNFIDSLNINSFF